MGFDVHRLVEGRALWLGGVNIPWERGLLGHSDADVAIHALCDALQEWKDKSSISGIFDSFKDNFAKRITYSVGAEYAYNQQFFLRGGYYYESKYAGNRQYFGLGAGFSLNVIKIDASYMIATAQNSPLDQTLRFTLSFDLDGIKDLFGRN